MHLKRLVFSSKKTKNKFIALGFHVVEVHSCISISKQKHPLMRLKSFLKSDAIVFKLKIQTIINHLCGTHVESFLLNSDAVQDTF